MELLANIIDDTDLRKVRRERAQVRRHSRLAGREGTFWRGTKRKDVRQIVFAARRFELKSRQFGKRSGALGTVAIEILDYLANLVDYRTGRLDPSLDTLMERLKRSRDAIVRALKALRTHGFLDWLRRYVPTGNEGRGVQVRQTSNAYRLMMPKKAKRLMGRYGRSAPTPDDFPHAQEQQAAIIEEYRDSLSMAELPLFDIEDKGLAEALSRLGSLMEKRESVQRSESVSKSITNTEERKKDTL